MQFRDKKRRKVLINITSLIDVLFLLLIFLMISSTFLEQPGIKLELPQAQSSAQMEQNEFTLYLDRAGKLYLNDKEINKGNLETKLSEVMAEMKDGVLTLKADQDVSHGLVVGIMDVIKKSGVKKLIIGTRLDK